MPHSGDFPPDWLGSKYRHRTLGHPQGTSQRLAPTGLLSRHPCQAHRSTNKEGPLETQRNNPAG